MLSKYHITGTRSESNAISFVLLGIILFSFFFFLFLLYAVEHKQVVTEDHYDFGFWTVLFMMRVSIFHKEVLKIQKLLLLHVPVLGSGGLGP